MLDIACGTGTLALHFAWKGWNVVGLDASENMLDLACKRAINANMTGQVSFIHGDMRSMRGVFPPASYDLVTCNYDSLNYLLTEEDLAACFESIAYVLDKKGLFIGDMNTRHYLEHDDGSCDIQEQDNYIEITRSDFDPLNATSTLHLTGFIGSDTQGYDRFDEMHVERAYPSDTVSGLLQQSGLTVEAVYQYFTLKPPDDTAQRIAWVARNHESVCYERLL